jgi:TonB family protein
VAKQEIMSPHEPKPEAAQSEAANQGEGEPAPSQELERAPSYPIRMQLPKAEGASNRTSEFAADSAAITAAMDEHLLPKPSLDFERFPGVAEPKTKLFSGKATRSLSGPIGVIVAAFLFLVAAGIATYQFGWLPKFGGKGSKSAADKSAFPPAAAVDSSPEQTDPANDFNSARDNLTRAENLPIATNSTHSRVPETPASSRTNSPNVAPAGNSHPESAASHSSARSTPERGPKPLGRSAAAAGEPPTVVNKGDDAIAPPKLIKGGRSLSPPEALRGYVSGNVVLDALVDETGHVKSATVLSGRKALQQRALDTVKEYLYQPATKNGKPVPVHVQVKIQFWYEP